METLVAAAVGRADEEDDERDDRMRGPDDAEGRWKRVDEVAVVVAAASCARSAAWLRSELNQLTMRSAWCCCSNSEDRRRSTLRKKSAQNKRKEKVEGE